MTVSTHWLHSGTFEAYLYAEDMENPVELICENLSPYKCQLIYFKQADSIACACDNAFRVEKSAGLNI